MISSNCHASLGECTAFVNDSGTDRLWNEVRGAHRTSLRALSGEVHHGRAAQRQDAHAWVVQRSILMRHYAVPWLVRIQQHMIWGLAWPKHLCIPCEPL